MVKGQVVTSWKVLIAAMVGFGLVVLPLLTQPSRGAPPPTPSLRHRVAALEAAVAALQSTVNAQAEQIAAMQATLAPFSTQLTDPGLPDGGYEVYLTNANLHIVNGLGATNGNPADPWTTDPAEIVTNGHGNLVIGYNEEWWWYPSRNGSHNIIVGPSHEYTSCGGLVAGFSNRVSAPYAAVSGGWGNTASGQHASVSGGRANTARGEGASVSGGLANTADGETASVSGGWENSASGHLTSVSGGLRNTASGDAASVSGGGGNTASGGYACVSGGLHNIASVEFGWAGGAYHTP